jgi:hypothetical protein
MTWMSQKDALRDYGVVEFFLLGVELEIKRYIKKCLHQLQSSSSFYYRIPVGDGDEYLSYNTFDKRG